MEIKKKTLAHYRDPCIENISLLMRILDIDEISLSELEFLLDKNKSNFLGAEKKYLRGNKVSVSYLSDKDQTLPIFRDPSEKEIEVVFNHLRFLMKQDVLDAFVDDFLNSQDKKES